jgi:hypothetical protein
MRKTPSHLLPLLRYWKRNYNRMDKRDGRAIWVKKWQGYKGTKGIKVR